MSNQIGHNIRLTLFGQSHAPAVGCVIEGLPAGVVFDWCEVNAFLKRRAPGQSRLTSPRSEQDEPEILSGLNEMGETCGAPLCALIRNTDHRSMDYAALRDTPRPGHADYTAYIRYRGHNDIRGGGQFSGRLTAPLCFAGALCRQLLAKRGVFVGARLRSVAGIEDAAVSWRQLDRALFDDLASKPLPVLDDAAGSRMREAIESAGQDGDSVGGVVEAYAVGAPAGLGDPMFDGVENQLARMVFGIPAVRGVEFGEGFAAASMRGSEHNDAFCRSEQGRVLTATDHHGGALGGITSGMPIIMRVAFKPTPSIARRQKTVSLTQNTETEISVQGRHDPCVALRAVPCVEAVMAFVICDMLGGNREDG